MADTTQKTDSVIPAEVRELIRESQKIHGWIGRLEEHAGDARPEVFEKVRADYGKRLAGVSDQLAEHRMALAETLETRRSEVDTLRTDRDQHAAELEEVQLRHAVGEFDDGDFEKRRGRIQSSLDDLDQLIADEDETVHELAEIIAMISGSGAAGSAEETAGAGAVGSASTPEDVETEAEAAPPEAGSEPADAEPDEPGTSAPEAESGPSADAEVQEASTAPTPRADEERSGGSGESGRKTGKRPPEPVTLEAEDDTEGGDYLDELEFLESLSLSEADRFDAVSAMLEEDEGKSPSD